MPAIPGPAYALLTALAWSIAVVLFKQSGETIHPVGLNAFKNVLALVLFALTIVVTGHVLPAASGTEYAWLLCSGALGIGVADTLFFKSLNLLGAGRSAIVDCSYAPAVVLVAYLLLDETLTLAHAAGAALIIAAVLLAVSRRDGQPLPRAELLRGIGYGVAAMVLMAIAIVMVKPILETREVLWCTTVRLVGGVASTAIWIAADRSVRQGTVRAFIPQRAWRFMLPGAFIGAYVSMLFWIAGFKYTQAGVASILNQTATLFTVLLAAIFLREPLTGRRVAALGLAMAGSVMVLVAP